MIEVTVQIEETIKQKRNVTFRTPDLEIFLATDPDEWYDLYKVTNEQSVSLLENHPHSITLIREAQLSFNPVKWNATKHNMVLWKEDE